MSQAIPPENPPYRPKVVWLRSCKKGEVYGSGVRVLPTPAGRKPYPSTERRESLLESFFIFQTSLSVAFLPLLHDRSETSFCHYRGFPGGIAGGNHGNGLGTMRQRARGRAHPGIAGRWRNVPRTAPRTARGIAARTADHGTKRPDAHRAFPYRHATEPGKERRAIAGPSIRRESGHSQPTRIHNKRAFRFHFSLCRRNHFGICRATLDRFSLQRLDFIFGSERQTSCL